MSNGTLQTSELAQRVEGVIQAAKIEQDDGRVTHHVTFAEDVRLLCRRELDSIRDAGYEIQSFGNNIKSRNNLTATFLEVDND